MLCTCCCAEHSCHTMHKPQLVGQASAAAMQKHAQQLAAAGGGGLDQHMARTCMWLSGASPAQEHAATRSPPCCERSWHLPSLLREKHGLTHSSFQTPGHCCSNNSTTARQRSICNGQRQAVDVVGIAAKDPRLRASPRQQIEQSCHHITAAHGTDRPACLACTSSDTCSAYVCQRTTSARITHASALQHSSCTLSAACRVACICVGHRSYKNDSPFRSSLLHACAVRH